MSPFETVETDILLAGHVAWAGPELAARLARGPLEAVDSEFPHYVRSMDGPDDVERPKERHPVFYGCYDWHSAVHSHWALIRQLRLFDDHPDEVDIVESIDARFTPANVDREVERFEADPTFEKPYGWAWLLRLATELSLWDDPRATAWRDTLSPLERTIVSLVESELVTEERPFRVGTHDNTAFALSAVLDYARTTSADALATAVADAATDHFGADRDYPVAYEPLGWDFLSPALTEADLMRRVYDAEAFTRWLDRFLPDLSTAPYDTILAPVDVASDPDDEAAFHLIGLDLSKAWCLAGLASAVDDHPHAAAFERSAARHAERGLDRAFTDAYAGSHWLPSFALYLLTRNDGGIAPA